MVKVLNNCKQNFMKNKIAAAQNRVDPEYSKNIVIKDGVRYLIIPSTNEVLMLPNVGD